MTRYILQLSLIMLVFTGMLSAQMTFEINTSSGDPNGVNWQDITSNVTIELETDGVTLKMYTVQPIENSLDMDNVHDWYIPVQHDQLPAELTQAWYSINYQADVVGLSPPSKGRLKQYWFRWKNSDGIASPPADCIYHTPKGPGVPVKE